MSQGKYPAVEPKLTEVAVHVAALDSIAASNEKIRKNNKRVLRKKVQVATSKMIELEADEDSGDESLDIFAQSQ